MLSDILTLTYLTGILAAAVRITTPLLFGSLGELVAERSGVMNLSIEGTMLMGALGSFAVSYYSGSLFLGILAGMTAGVMLTTVFAFMTIGLKIDQTVSGLTINIFSSGIAFFLYRTMFPRLDGGNLPNIAILTKTPVPLLHRIPILGEAFFNHNILVYLALLLLPVISIFLYRTKIGLTLRCVGENPRAVDMKGIHVGRYQFLAVLFGGMMSGLAGSYLTLGSAGMWLPDIAAGRGWIAFAIVIFGDWKPGGILAASFFFGFLDALQLQIQGIGVKIPYQILLALPYLLTILALLWKRRVVSEPLSLGVPYVREA